MTRYRLRSARGFSWIEDMEFKAWKYLLLVAVVLLQVGCATERKTYDDTTPLDSSTSQEDDSHGWGTNIQSAGH